jgi:hypothetical protein
VTRTMSLEVADGSFRLIGEPADEESVVRSSASPGGSADGLIWGLRPIQEKGPPQR